MQVSLLKKKTPQTAAPQEVVVETDGADWFTDTVAGEAISTDSLLQSGADILSYEPHVQSVVAMAREGGAGSAAVPLVYGVHFQLEGPTNRRIRWLGATSTVPLEATDQLVIKARRRTT